jgi:hypothetical protein
MERQLAQPASRFRVSTACSCPPTPHHFHAKIFELFRAKKCNITLLNKKSKKKRLSQILILF